MRRIGIFGGTFNPIHLGHLLLAEGAREEVPLDEVVWVPAHLPSHKQISGNATAEDRYRMVDLAIQGQPHFRLSRVELDRPPPSYTVDTVRLLKEASKEANVEWFFLLGSDAAKGLPSWRRIEELSKLVQFIVIPRPGSPAPGLPSYVREIRVETLSVSASEIRERIRQGRSIRYRVPETVRQYIEDHGLYR